MASPRAWPTRHSPRAGTMKRTRILTKWGGRVSRQRQALPHAGSHRRPCTGGCGRRRRHMARHRQMLPLSTVSYVALTYPSTDPKFLAQRARLIGVCAGPSTRRANRCTSGSHVAWILVAAAIVRARGALATPAADEHPDLSRPRHRQHASPGRHPGPVRIAAAEGNTLSIPAVLFKPAGAAKGAVVVVNAAPGWSDFREGHYGRALSSAGYAVLAIDTYGPRGVADAPGGPRQGQHPRAGARRIRCQEFLISMGYARDRMASWGPAAAEPSRLLTADRPSCKTRMDRFVLAMLDQRGVHLPSARTDDRAPGCSWPSPRRTGSRAWSRARSSRQEYAAAARRLSP
jgi:hypothetical protein